MNTIELREKLLLYLICGEGEKPELLLEKTRLALEGGVTAVQLRVKTWSTRETYDAALEMRRLAHERSALFFINDRLDVALACGADGVHLGQSDLPIAKAREIAGCNFTIGGTARTLELAKKAEADGADYIGCGSAFETSTKDDAVVIGPSGIKNVLSHIRIPGVAIGGIELSNAPRLAGCGCAGIALSSSIMKSPDPKSAAEKLLKTAREIAS